MTRRKSFKIFITIILLLSFFSFGPKKVSAHNVTSKPWILINGEYLLEEDNNPRPALLVATEHVLTKTFNSNEKISFEIQDAEIEKEYKVSKLDIEMKIFAVKDFQINTESQSTKTTEQNDVYYAFDTDSLSFSMTQEGSYPVFVTINGDGDELFDESFLLQIGNPISSSNFSINDKSVVDLNKYLVLDNESQIQLNVIDPDSSSTYMWDLGNGTTLLGTHVTTSYKINETTYLVLRRMKGFSYADSYIKLDPKQKYIVPMPPIGTSFVQPASAPVSSDNSNLILIYALSIIVIGVLVGALVSFFKRV